MNPYKKYTFKTTAILSLLFATFIFSCHSVEEKSDGAYEKAKISKEFTDDSLNMETEAKLVPLLATKPIKVVVVDSWTNYSTEIEKTIQLNEKMIADLQVDSTSDVKKFKKVVALKKNNQELKNRLFDFNQEVEANLEKFKSDLKADMIELSDEIQLLSIK